MELKMNYIINKYLNKTKLLPVCTKMNTKSTKQKRIFKFRILRRAMKNQYITTPKFTKSYTHTTHIIMAKH